jgi:hypothetical protein
MVQVKYLAKDANSPAHILSVLMDARAHVALHPSVADDSGTVLRTAMHTLTRVMNTLNGVSEVSATTAALCLLGGANEFFSHGFWYLSPWLARKHAVEARQLAGFDDSSGMIPFDSANDAEDGSTQVSADGEVGADTAAADDSEMGELERFVAATFTDDVTATTAVRTGHAPEEDDGEGEVVCRNGKPCVVGQVPGYASRGAGLAGLCMLEYTAIVMTRTVTAADAAAAEREGGDDDGAADGTPGTRARRGAGRPRNGTFAFDADHPLHDRRVQVLRSKLLVPILGGACPPPHPGRRVATAKWEKAAQTFAEYYLTMLVPWKRLANGVCGPDVPLTWDTMVAWFMFEGDFRGDKQSYAGRCLREVADDIVFGLRVNRGHKGLLNAWRMRHSDTQAEAIAARAAQRTAAVLAETGEESDSDEAYQNEFVLGGDRGAAAMTPAELAATKIAGDRIQEELTAIDGHDKAEPLTAVALRELHNVQEAGLARAAVEHGATADSSMEPGSAPPALPRFIFAGTQAHVDATEATLTKKARPADARPDHAAIADQQRREHDARIVYKGVGSGDRRCDASVWDDVVAAEVDEQPDDRLNDEQNAAFVEIIAATNRLVRYDAHLEQYTLAEQAGSATALPVPPQRPDAPSYFVTGCAGSGKSFFAQVVCDRLSYDRVVVSASTGAAASIVRRATTVHNLFGMKVYDHAATKATHRKEYFTALTPAHIKKIRVRIPDGVHMLILDELSMIPTLLLARVDAALRAARNSTAPFGGMVVVALGDMLQLPAIGWSLTQAAVSPCSEDGNGGAALFRRFVVLDFKTQMRVRDAAYGRVVNRFRTSMRTPVDAVTLRALRPLTAADVAADPRWGFAPVVFTTNYARCVHNKQSMVRFCRERGIPCVGWRLSMTVDSTAVLQAAQSSRTSHVDGGDDGDGAASAPTRAARRVSIKALGDALADRWYSDACCPGATVLFAPGAPAILTENINPTLGLANGSAVVLHSLSIHPNDLPDIEQRIARAVPGEIVLLTMPPLSVNVHIKSLAPTYNDDGSIKVPTPDWATALDMRGPVSVAGARSRRQQSGDVHSDSSGSDDDTPATVAAAARAVDGTREPDLGPVFGIRPLTRFASEKSADNAGPRYKAKLKEYGVTNPESIFDAGFGFTYHKVQGGTYDLIILDLTQGQSLLSAASLYVGMTRVREGRCIRVLPTSANEHNDLRHLTNLSFSPHVVTWCQSLVPVAAASLVAIAGETVPAAAVSAAGGTVSAASASSASAGAPPQPRSLLSARVFSVQRLAQLIATADAAAAAKASKKAAGVGTNAVSRAGCKLTGARSSKSGTPAATPRQSPARPGASAGVGRGVTASPATSTPGRGILRAAASMRGSPAKPDHRTVHFAPVGVAVSAPMTSAPPTAPLRRIVMAAQSPRGRGGPAVAVATPPRAPRPAPESLLVTVQHGCVASDLVRRAQSAGKIPARAGGQASQPLVTPASGGSSGAGQRDVVLLAARALTALESVGSDGVLVYPIRPPHVTPLAILRGVAGLYQADVAAQGVQNVDGNDLRPLGLFNESTYCFANAGTQMLATVPQLTSALRRADLTAALASPGDETRDAAVFVDAWRSLLSRLAGWQDRHAGSEAFLQTQRVYSTMHRVRSFRGMQPHRQQDAAEFVVNAVDVVASLLQRGGADASNMGSLDDVQGALVGFESSRFRCARCGSTWLGGVGVRSFTTVELGITAAAERDHDGAPVAAVTLASCVDAYSGEEVTEQETECASATCDADTVAARRAWLLYYRARDTHRPPDIPAASRVYRRLQLNHAARYVVVTLKRFAQDVRGRNIKITTAVTIPPVVQLPLTIVPGDDMSTIIVDFDVVASIVSHPRRVRRSRNPSLRCVARLCACRRISAPRPRPLRPSE